MNCSQLVKDIMKKEGLKMIEASQYIKQNNLYTPKAKAEKAPKIPKMSKIPKTHQFSKIPKIPKTAKIPKIPKKI